MLTLTVLVAVFLIYSGIITYTATKISRENLELEKSKCINEVDKFVGETHKFRLTNQSFLLHVLKKELAEYEKLQKELNKLDKALEE